jgi:hypothetical protein
MKILYLIFGLLCAAGIPLGMLKIAIYFSDNLNNKSNDDARKNATDSK